MTTNLLESIQQQLTPDMIEHVSSFLGETPAHTQIAVDKSIPTVLAGLMCFSSSSASPIPLLNLLNRAHYGSPLNKLSGLFEGGNTTQNLMIAGWEILNTLFAGKLSTVSELIAAASGVTNTSASSLLSIVAPVVVGVLERMRSTQGLNAARLATLLMGQKEVVAKLAPEGLARVFGLHSIADLGSEPEDEATEGLELDTLRRAVAAPVKGESILKNWGWPVLAVVALGLIYFFIMGRGAEVAQAPMVTVVSADTPAVVTVPLPGGTALSLEEGSFNYNVAAFLRDNAMSTMPKTFVFDRLHFDSGTTKLTVESEQTVKDLGAILKAYPTSDVRLDGYTDNVGDAATNKQLSLDRATAVREALISDGMDAARVTTAGYGQENPLAYNGTEEGRAKNRRLELVVVKK